MGAGRAGTRRDYLMNKPRLQQVQLKNFRSIRGRIDVPLDADIVLIHGSNGTGKTSVLSGIELGLTGKIATMASIADDYASHLLHEGTADGNVRLSIDSGQKSEGKWSHITLRPRSIDGMPALDTASSQFFTERCYLAQSTLGRLLELYQASDKRGDSLLTRFVNDLLGLDQLDALIEGLEKSGDIRATRKFITALAEQERLAESLRAECEGLKNQIAILKREAFGRDHPSASRFSTKREVGAADIPQEIEAIDAQLERLLPQLTELKQLNKQLNDASAGGELATLQFADSQQERDSRAWSDWNSIWRPRLHAISSKAYATLGIDDETYTGSPAKGVAKLQDLLQEFTTFARSRIQEHSELEQRIRQLKAESAQLISQRHALIAAENDLSAGQSPAGLGQALAALLPHIDSELCPACGRDFQEVSEQPLIDRVRAAASAMNKLAERLQAIRDDLRQLDERRSSLDQAIASLVLKLDPLNERASLESKLETLAEVERALAAWNTEVSTGERLWRAAEASANRRASLEASGVRLSALRRRVQEIAQSNNYPIDSPNDWSRATEHIERMLDEQVTALGGYRTSLTEYAESRRATERLHMETSMLQGRFQEAKKALDRVESQLETARGRIELARTLMKTAVGVRQNVVAEVFDANLNDTWKNLFIKLAPGEPFAPKFVVKPRGRAKAGAELQVVHRNSKRSGPPSALLSAGNLNTAALTLFLSLHLAAEAKLPWLILDDPVQAMDDIHISHFAALLRSFAHDLSRQVVIAVHERSLFDYLALELSPARPGQRLITVELTRKSVGDTQATIETIDWQEDKAIV